MITQEYIDDELTLAKKLFLYYTEKMVDYLRINNQNYSKWYRDSLQLYFLVKFIENIKIVGDVGNVKTTSGDVEISGNVTGSIQTMSGDVKCKTVGGSVTTMSGDIKHK